MTEMKKPNECTTRELEININKLEDKLHQYKSELLLRENDYKSMEGKCFKRLDLFLDGISIIKITNYNSFDRTFNCYEITKENCDESRHYITIGTFTYDKHYFTENENLIEIPSEECDFLLIDMLNQTTTMFADALVTNI